MDEEQPLTVGHSDPLDVEIRRALAVAPSPEFVAKVRLRVAEEPQITGWRTLPLAALTAVALMAVVTFVLVSQFSGQQPEPIASTHVSPTVVEATVAPPQARVDQVPERSRPRPVEARRPLSVVSKGEIEWYRSLAVAANRGRLILATLDEPVHESAADGLAVGATDEEPGLPKLVIEELVIEPITQ